MLYKHVLVFNLFCITNVYTNGPFLPFRFYGQMSVDHFELTFPTKCKKSIFSYRVKSYKNSSSTGRNGTVDCCNKGNNSFKQST